MLAKSHYLENQIADFLYRGQTFTPPATHYVALFTCTNGIVARSTAYALNNTVVAMTSDGTYHLYSCTTAGTTAASAPTYPGVVGEAITDGTATFTEQTQAVKAGTALVEPSGNNYARVALSSSLTAMSGTQGAGTTVASTGTSGEISNNAQINFATTTGNWAAAPAMVWASGTYDAPTGGNLYHISTAGSPASIGTGVQPYIAAGSFKIDEK